MITSKKGVSTVVANVLIVLLVIVGIAVIWAVVNPTIEQSAEGIQTANCFNLNIQPRSCVFTAGATAAAQGSASVQIERGAGQGALAGLKYIFTDANGVTQVIEAPAAVATGLDELETTTLQTVAIPAAFTPTSFNVAAVIGSAGNTQTCDAVAQAIGCTAPAPPGPAP